MLRLEILGLWFNDAVYLGWEYNVGDDIIIGDKYKMLLNKYTNRTCMYSLHKETIEIRALEFYFQIPKNREVILEINRLNKKPYKAKLAERFEDLKLDVTLWFNSVESDL